MAPKKKENAIAEDAEDLKAGLETELVISLLKSRLGRYQAAGEKLEVEGFRLTDELAQQKLTLQDINEFLTNELKARSVATTQEYKLEERVVELTAKVHEVQKEAQAEAARVKVQAAAEVEAATSRVAELTSQLEGSSEFLQQREAMESQLAQLRAALATKAKEVDQKLSDLERRHLQDKERARQEMANKIRETKISMAQLADQHLEGSTKRTLAENEAMARQLAYHEAASAGLVEANNELRADVGELRRQLGVAKKTVESTARKNLLLQQTIKAILHYLQHEGAAAAAGATGKAIAGDSRAASPLFDNQPLGGSTGFHGKAGEVGKLQQCLSFALRSNSPGPAKCAEEVDYQQQQAPWPGLALDGQGTVSIGCVRAGGNLHNHPLNEPAVQSCDHAAPDALVQQSPSDMYTQQQQCTMTASRSAAGTIAQQLEQQVTKLSDELAAAKQALAAAMQGLLPDGCAARVVVLPDTLTSTDEAQQEQQQQNGSTRLTSAEAFAAHGPAVAVMRPKMHLEGGLAGRQVHSVAPEVQTIGATASVAGMTYRNSALQQQPQTPKPDTPNGRNCISNSSRNAVGSSSTPASPKHHALCKGLAHIASSGNSRPAGTGVGLSAALDDGVAAFVLHCIQQLRSNSSSASQQPGFSSASPSACNCPVGRAVQPHSSIAAVTGLWRDGADNEAAAREYLARLLLGQLHVYAYNKVAAFQGLSFELPGMEPSSNDAATVAATAAASDAATTVQQSNAASGPGAERCSNPCLCDCAAFACNGRLTQSSGEQHQTQPVLPLLPTLLDKAPAVIPVNTGSTPPGYVAAGSDHGSSGVCSSTEDLFSAVLSDAWPWGSGSLQARGQIVALGQQKQQRSQTPTSPKRVQAQQHMQVSPKACSPDLLQPGMQHHAAAWSNSNKGTSDSAGAGRLAKAANAVTGHGGLGELLGYSLRSRPTQ